MKRDKLIDNDDSNVQMALKFVGADQAHAYRAQIAQHNEALAIKQEQEMELLLLNEKRAEQERWLRNKQEAEERRRKTSGCLLSVIIWFGSILGLCSIIVSAIPPTDIAANLIIGLLAVAFSTVITVMFNKWHKKR